MLACYSVHYLSNNKDPAIFNVLARSACHAVQLMWRYAKIFFPDDYGTRFFYEVISMIRSFKFQAGVYEAFPAHGVNGNLVGFYINLYCIYDGHSVYVFYNESDQIDNYLMIKELGFDVSFFKQMLLVTPMNFNSIYNDINYVYSTLVNR